MEKENQQNTPEEHKNIGIGMSTGIGLGLLFGLIFKNLALGLLIGVAVGAFLDHSSGKK